MRARSTSGTRSRAAAGVIDLGHHPGERAATRYPASVRLRRRRQWSAPTAPRRPPGSASTSASIPLDACLLPAPGGKPRTASFANDAAGHAALLAWADDPAGGTAPGFCLESTGAYGEALATTLADPGRHVAVVNPARVKYAGLMRGQGNKTDRAAAKLIAASERLRADRALLRTIPGIGPVAAHALLAELPDPARFATAQQAAAYAGLAPREYRSGTSVKKRTRLSKAGNARLRKALDLPAMTAIRFNPLVGAFYARLVEAGKAKMAALGACMRKLLMIAYGVLKSRTPFDPSRGGKMAS